MDRAAFSAVLRNAIVAALDEFACQHPADEPYGFALVGGQCCNLACYAIASENGLRREAEYYHRLGYRYDGFFGEVWDDFEKLSSWLRWDNPDAGWYYGDFPEHFGIQTTLKRLVASEGLDEKSDDIEELCTDALASLNNEAAWRRWSGVIVGFTYGEDPRDFLRTATRANPYFLVRKLWAEQWQADELERRIKRPNQRNAE